MQRAKLILQQIRDFRVSSRPEPQESAIFRVDPRLMVLADVS
jgi:hypothetical protein